MTGAVCRLFSHQHDLEAIRMDKRGPKVTVISTRYLHENGKLLWSKPEFLRDFLREAKIKETLEEFKTVATRELAK